MATFSTHVASHSPSATPCHENVVLTGVADDTLRYSVSGVLNLIGLCALLKRRIELHGHASCAAHQNPAHLGRLDYEVAAACQGVSQRFYGGLIHAPPPETTGCLRKKKKSTLRIGTGTRPPVGALAALSTPALAGLSPAIRYRLPLGWCVYGVATRCGP